MCKLNKFLKANRPKIVTVLIDHNNGNYTVEDLRNYGQYLGFKYCGCSVNWFAPFKLTRTDIPTESYWSVQAKLSYVADFHRNNMLGSFDTSHLCVHLETTDKAEAVALAIKLHSSAILN